MRLIINDEGQTLNILLTSQNVDDQLHVSAELFDVVQVGHRHYWHILVTVHLGDEVHVTGQILPERQKKKQRSLVTLQDAAQTCWRWNFIHIY